MPTVWLAMQNPDLEVVAIVCGTDEDPQDLSAQIQQLEDAGAWVDTSNDSVVRYVGRLAHSLDPDASEAEIAPFKGVDLEALNRPLAAINVGLESFMESLIAQQAQAIHVDWRPAAGGNEKLMSILERMRKQ